MRDYRTSWAHYKNVVYWWSTDWRSYSQVALVRLLVVAYLSHNLSYLMLSMLSSNLLRTQSLFAGLLFFVIFKPPWIIHSSPGAPSIYMHILTQIAIVTLMTVKSTTSFCIFLGSFLISWKSREQNVSCSAVKVEFWALAHTASETVLLRWLLHDMGVLIISSSTPCYCDHRRSIQLHSIIFSRTDKAHRNRHLVQCHVCIGIIQLSFVPSTDQVSDH